MQTTLSLQESYRRDGFVLGPRLAEPDAVEAVDPAHGRRDRR